MQDWEWIEERTHITAISKAICVLQHDPRVLGVLLRQVSFVCVCVCMYVCVRVCVCACVCVSWASSSNR